MRWVNNVKTAMLLAGLIGLCMAIGSIWGSEGILIGLIFGAFGNIIAFFFSDKIAMASMGAQEVSPDDAPQLHAIVGRLAEQAGIPKPRVFVAPQAAPNAFATGRSPRHAAVAVTEGMLRGFPMHEIEGVLAHELAHVKHRDVLIATIASVMAGLISYAAWMGMWFGGGRGGRENPFGAIGALLMIVLAPLAAGLIQAAISRQREFVADSYGGELCGNPLKLAGALERLSLANQQIPTDTPPAFHNLYIVQPLSTSQMASWFSTHPPIEQRIAALRNQARQMA